METTLIIVKPDAVQRGLIGEIVSRFERKGLAVVGAKMMRITRELAGRHYAEHQGKPFYEGLVQFMTSNPVVVLAVRGPEAIAVGRSLMGATNAIEASPGTIRGDFGLSKGYNLVHGSDGAESAKRELSLFFDERELFDYEMAVGQWVVER